MESNFNCVFFIFINSMSLMSELIPLNLWSSLFIRIESMLIKLPISQLY